MRKAEFLKCLEKMLNVLNEKERTDILNEYSQHIDFKIASGLSEEDAISDFGALDELASEILDAYNVNPNYKKFKLPKIQISTKKLRTGISGIAHKFIGRLRLVPGKFKAWLCSLAVKLNGLFIRNPKKEPIEKKVKPVKENKVIPKMNIGRSIKKAGGITVRGLRLCLNFTLTVFLLPFVLAAFLLIVLLGTLLVLTVMGYPAIGVTLITIGILLCLLAFIVWVGCKIHAKGGNNYD